MHNAMVPEELPVVHWNLLASGHHQLQYLLKFTFGGLEKKGTYAFPVLTLLGLMSLDLKLAKKSSHGAAE